ncbi:MAG TPA: hypothetical protein VLG46_00200 [Anaerolineae bacterium]|nr:hypothetical protein [Anaerolineae bacterium]
MQQTLSINRGRLSVLVALIVLSFALLPLIEAPPAGSVGTSFLGTPLRLDFTATTIVLLLVTVLTCAGVAQLVRDHPRVRRGEVKRTFSFLILPAITVIVAAQLLINITDTPLWILSLGVIAAILWLTFLAEYAVVDPEGPLASRARLFLTALTYLLAVLLFGLIWNTRARSSISATLTLLVVTGLAFDLLYATGARPSRVLIFSISIGLVLAEGNWAINYWRSNVFIAAVAQLLAFYALIDLAGQHLLDRISRRVLIELGVVLSIVLILLLLGRL